MERSKSASAICGAAPKTTSSSYDRWHAENRAAIAALAQKLDRHADTVAALRPAVAALELSRSKLAAWASIGFAGVVVLGWIVEGAVKWTVG